MQILWTTVAVIAVLAVVWFVYSRCPQCRSFRTSGPPKESGGKGFSVRWAQFIDPRNGDFYVLKHYRMCNACGHAWVTAIDDIFGEEPRPNPHKLIDGETLKAIERHARAGGTFAD